MWIFENFQHHQVANTTQRDVAPLPLSWQHKRFFILMVPLYHPNSGLHERYTKYDWINWNNFQIYQSPLYFRTHSMSHNYVEQTWWAALIASCWHTLLSNDTINVTINDTSKSIILKQQEMLWIISFYQIVTSWNVTSWSRRTSYTKPAGFVSECRRTDGRRINPPMIWYDVWWFVDDSDMIRLSLLWWLL